MMREIFVFGSNLAGRHGKGAAKFAREYYGAEYGVGEGLTGNSYALPTKDENLQTRSLREIQTSLAKLAEFARRHYNFIFYLTPIGCGLAGYKQEHIIELVLKAEMPDNVILTQEWEVEYRERYDDSLD